MWRPSVGTCCKNLLCRPVVKTWCGDLVWGPVVGTCYKNLVWRLGVEISSSIFRQVLSQWNTSWTWILNKMGTTFFNNKLNTNQRKNSILTYHQERAKRHWNHLHLLTLIQLDLPLYLLCRSACMYKLWNLFVIQEK